MASSTSFRKSHRLDRAASCSRPRPRRALARNRAVDAIATLGQTPSATVRTSQGALGGSQKRRLNPALDSLSSGQKLDLEASKFWMRAQTGDLGLLKMMGTNPDRRFLHLLRATGQGFQDKAAGGVPFAARIFP